MAGIIKTTNLVKDLVLTKRDIPESREVSSLDVDQVDGKILVTRPYNEDGTIGGDITIYPPSLRLEINEPVSYNVFLAAGELYYPLDARFDYVRRKIWIADTGNHRLLKINRDNGQMDVVVRDKMYYPHALAINENDGGVFAKGYYDLSDLSKKVVFQFKSNGEELANFKFHRSIVDSSSSSSSEGYSSSSSSSSSMELSSSSSSSSSGVFFPRFPSPYSIIYDHVRSRVWWTDLSYVYLADTRNKQVQIYDLEEDGFVDTRSIDVELSTGNVVVVAIDEYGDWWLVQLNRDNNKFLGQAFVAKE